VKIGTRNLFSKRRFTPPPPPFVKQVARRIFTHEKYFPAGEVNFIFTDNHKITQLNWKFLRHKGPTDVIAFGYDSHQGSASTVFGDIFISIEQARSNAQRFGQPPKREVTRLIIHGVLHLLGYSDSKPKDKKKMWARQEKFVDAIHGPLT